MALTDNKNHKINLLTLPLPPEDPCGLQRMEMDVYARFMRHVRTVPCSRPEIQVLAAIQFVADMMNLEDADVTRILVDLGLRAPRLAFPEAYLEFADMALMREVHQIGMASVSLHALKAHWDEIGEDRFVAFRRYYPTLTEGLHSHA